MKDWRPKGWDKVNPKPIGKSMAYAFNREHMYKHGEACADAMLEALKKNAFFIRGMMVEDDSMPPVDIPNERGYWAFRSRE